MVAGEPDKGINDPVVQELPWHPLNSGGGSIFPDIQGEDQGERGGGGFGGLETVPVVLSHIIQRAHRFVRNEKFAD